MLDYFKQLKIKTKLFLLAFISISGLILLSSFLFISLEFTTKLSDGIAKVVKLHTNLLTFRRYEKDYLSRKEEKYLIEFNKNLTEMKKDINQLNEILIKSNIDNTILKTFEQELENYKELFFQLIKNDLLLEQNYDEGIHLKMRQASHRAEDILDIIDRTIEKELENKISNAKYIVYFLSLFVSFLILLFSRLIVKNIVNDFQKRVDEKTKALEENISKLKSMQAELIQNEKMASLGSLVAGVSHEINTPIGMALTTSTHLNKELNSLKKSYLNEEMSEKEFLEYLEDSKLSIDSINKNLIRAVNLIKSFKQIAVDQISEELREFNLKEYLDEILLSIHSKIKMTKIKIEVNIDKNIAINSYAGIFSQIFTNLIINSIIHGFNNGVDIGTIKISANLENNDLTIYYEDDGKGLDEVTKNKIFDPFYTTNRVKGGSGLGMNIVYNLVVKKLKGTIFLENKKEKGVLFVIKCKI